jgi:hypothetical protein
VADAGLKGAQRGQQGKTVFIPAISSASLWGYRRPGA